MGYIVAKHRRLVVVGMAAGVLLVVILAALRASGPPSTSKVARAQSGSEVSSISPLEI